jgi:protein-S-isoprenylcysteine O-methyltransferase Ste14
MLAAARPRPGLYAAGLVLAVLGVAIRLWAAGTIHKGREITISGPYAWVRHPLYVGSFVIALGYFAMSGLWEAFAIGVPLFVALHWAAVVVEERMLIALFGSEYEDYCRKVPRALPRPPRTPAAGDFSWPQALYNREPLHIVGVVLLAALFAVIMVLKR